MQMRSSDGMQQLSRRDMHGTVLVCQLSLLTPESSTGARLLGGIITTEDLCRNTNS